MMVWWEKTALILAAVGAINWALHSLDYGLIDLIFSSWPAVVTGLYWIIAICGVYALVKAVK